MPDEFDTRAPPAPGSAEGEVLCTALHSIKECHLEYRCPCHPVWRCANPLPCGSGNWRDAGEMSRLNLHTSADMMRPSNRYQ